MWTNDCFPPPLRSGFAQMRSSVKTEPLDLLPIKKHNQHMGSLRRRISNSNDESALKENGCQDNSPSSRFIYLLCSSALI